CLHQEIYVAPSVVHLKKTLNDRIGATLLTINFIKFLCKFAALAACVCYFLSFTKKCFLEATKLGLNMVPKRIFLTNGVGKHRERLTSFELALRDAGIAAQNLVRVSSIFPPHCKLISRKEGVKYLHPGEVTFAVVAENSTREPHRLTAASIGLAMP